MSEENKNEAKGKITDPNKFDVGEAGPEDIGPKVIEMENASVTKSISDLTPPKGYDREWAQGLYGEAQSDYLKFLNTLTNKDKLEADYNAVRVPDDIKGDTKKTEDFRLFGPVNWVKCLLKPKNYTQLQFDHILGLKSEMDSIAQDQARIVKGMREKNLDLPDNWNTLISRKLTAERSYYSHGARIFYTIQVGTGEARDILPEDLEQIDRIQLKTAVDLAWLKSEKGPKNQGTLPN